MSKPRPSRRADARPVALSTAGRALEEISREEDIGITVNALTDPDLPPYGFYEEAASRKARPKRTVEIALDLDLLGQLEEMPDWRERANEILRLAAGLSSVCRDD